jgi:hypothetical protein
VEPTPPRLWSGLREIGWLLIFAFFVPIAVLLIGLPIAAIIRLLDSLFNR